MSEGRQAWGDGPEVPRAALAPGPRSRPSPVLRAHELTVTSGVDRPPSLPRRLVLLPTLNEEKGLEATLRELEKIPFRSPQTPPSVLVIDGHSTDGTRRVVESWGVPFLHQKTRGKGAAIREGLQWAADHGFSSVAVMDADGTYAAASLPALFDLLDHGSELVVGIRRTDAPPTTTLRDFVHRIGNGLLNYTAAQFSGQPVLDICSGFWGLRTSSLPCLRLESDGFEIESELFVKAFRAGLQVSQIPVAYRDRVGEAKLHAVRDGARILISILRHSLRKKQPNGSASRSSAPRAFRRRPLLDSVLLALGPERVVLLSDVARLGEADRVARRITAAAPFASVATAVLASHARWPEHSLLSGLTDRGTGIGPTVVVTLPAPSQIPGDPHPLLVGIPRTGRLVHFPAEDAQEEENQRPDPRFGDAYLPEHVPRGLLAALFILSSTLEPTWTRRELALLEANANGAPMNIYRRSPAEGLPAPRAAGNALFSWVRGLQARGV
ncbi:MAG TPA: glycosyltransferase family 2 protein [Thermoplasmata archaeon]|nr:glycosyltransferase family 2 protein [Thermoplasmata archaeon]